MGYVLLSWGVGVVVDKVKVVVEVRELELVLEVRLFLGLVNYSGRFILDFVIFLELLWRLMKKDVEF